MRPIPTRTDLRSPKQKSLIGTLWFFQSLRKGFFQLEDTKPSIEQVEGCWLIRHKTSWHKSRKAKYRIETVMGNRKDAQAVASRLAAETAAKYKLGSNPKLKEVADGIWTVTVFNGYVDTMERTIAPEAFIGTEQDATRHALEQWSNRRILPCAGETLRGHWETALRKHGLRFIPVNNLRHTSETLMAASGFRLRQFQACTDIRSLRRISSTIST